MSPVDRPHRTFSLSLWSGVCPLPCEGGGGGGDTTSRTAHVTPSGRGFNDLSLLVRHGTNNFSLLLGLSIFFIYLHGRCRYVDICCQLNFDVSIFFSAPISLICMDTALCGTSISREVCHNISDRSSTCLSGSEELRN